MLKALDCVAQEEYVERLSVIPWCFSEVGPYGPAKVPAIDLRFGFAEPVPVPVPDGVSEEE